MQSTVQSNPEPVAQSFLHKYVIDPIIGIVKFIIGGFILILFVLAYAQQMINDMEMNSCIREATYKIHDHDVAVHYCKMLKLQQG